MTRSPFKKGLLCLTLCIVGPFIYSYLIWYLPVLIVSALGILIFNFLYAGAAVEIFNINHKTSVIEKVFLSAITAVTTWWIYWIFWIDLTLNQTRWLKLDIPLVPVDYLKISYPDFIQCLHLFFNPNKVWSFMSVTATNGYYELLSFRPSGNIQLFLWIFEIIFSFYLIYTFNDNPEN
jgi:hypothetical protein